MTGILAFSTSNYDAMKKFLSEIGFEVREDSGDQLVPLFNEGRGAYVKRGDLDFNLEESISQDAKASFNLLLFGYSRKEIEAIKSFGHRCEESGPTLYGRHYSFRTPDGGTITIQEEGSVLGRVVDTLKGGDCAV